MTQTNNGGGSPAGATANQRDERKNDSTVDAAVFGVVELRLSGPGHRGPIPPGVRVRLDVGNAEFWEAADLRRVAWDTWRAGSVEVTGRRADIVGAVVCALRRAHQEMAATEARHAARMASVFPDPLGGAA